MSVNDYQKFVSTTSGAFSSLTVEQGRIAAAALGLVGEAGEASEVIKKHLFHGHDMPKDKIQKELGDVLWYVTELCNALGITLEEVMSMNIEKLSKRYGGEWSTKKSIERIDVAESQAQISEERA
jgi:NTP pyrophosphatase (non-canonical NTP hydrolase)